MEVAFSNSFKKAFEKSIKSTDIEAYFWINLEVFVNDPFDIRLRTHKLSGRLKDLWSFSIGYDTRIVFYFTKDKPKRAIFVDIGTHDQVY
jgi:mRNA-degrading endonuclease YafQ of YafQ-DinJ toxin-antitoxin module